MKDFIEEKLLPPVMKFVGSTPVTAVKEGFIATLSLTIVGSIFLLLAFFPYQPVADFFANAGLTPWLMQAYNATFNMLALVAAFSIAYSYAKQKQIEPLAAGILSLVTYILLIEFDSFEGVGGTFINFGYLGSRGMVAAIVIGLIVGWIYSWFLVRDIKINMPAGVPPGVANSFAAIIPAAVIITLAMILYGVLRMNGTNFIDLIYTIIQIPLQGMTSSLPGALLMAFVGPFLWWFGVHGASIVSGIIGGVLNANTLHNQAIIDAGNALNLANGGYIVTKQFLDNLLIITGSGITIGLVVFFLFFAKSEQFKSLGKLSGPSSLFNINEPVLFGMPIVLNPIMFVPFVLVPLMAAAVSYFAFATGLVPLTGGIIPPWTTPPIISGFLIGGWRMAVLQLVIILLSVAIYFPFARKQDAMNLEQEQAMAQEEQA